MEHSPLHRRSVVAGAAGLALTQAVLGGVFWLGTQTADAPSPIDVAPTTSPTTAVDRAGAGLRTSDQDPCAPTFTEPGVCMIGAALDDDGHVVIDLEYRNVEPHRIGLGGDDDIHAHLFPSDSSTESVGAPGNFSIGGGEWQISDAQRVVLASQHDAYLSRTGEICVATATNTHTLLHLHESCLVIDS